jgi:peroxiredoxin
MNQRGMRYESRDFAAPPKSVEVRMSRDVIVGSRVPNVPLGYIVDGQVEIIESEKVFSKRRCIVLGIPGAFTPICSTQHVPDFIQNAAVLKKSGYNNLISIVANDPFSIEKWRQEVDPSGLIQFLSDGNLEFCSALGFVSSANNLFMGRRSQRYLLFVEDMIIQRFKVETNIENYQLTRAVDAIR